MTNHPVHSRNCFFPFPFLLLATAVLCLFPMRAGITASQADSSRQTMAGDNPAASQSPPEENPATQAPAKMVRKMRKELMEENFQQMKKDSADLTELAQALQQDLDKSNVHILSRSCGQGGEDREAGEENQDHREGVLGQILFTSVV